MTMSMETATRVAFARFRLSGHTADDPQIIEGRWVPCTCQEREDAITAAGGYDALSVWSGFTDCDGEFGTPQWFTEWGSKDGTAPVAADWKPLPSGTCRHLRYVVGRGVDHCGHLLTPCGCDVPPSPYDSCYTAADLYVLGMEQDGRA